MTKLRVLQILLAAIGVLSALAGLILLLATGWLFSLLALPAEPVFFIIAFKAVGAVAIGLGYASSVAARDPERNVVVVDLLIIIMVLAAAVGAYAEIAFHFAVGNVSTSLVWAGSAVRLILAIVLLALRPRTSLFN